jgi:hypothetical protein
MLPRAVQDFVCQPPTATKHPYNSLSLFVSPSPSILLLAQTTDISVTMALRTRASSWLPRLNFIRIHYAWVIFCALVAFPVLMPQGNLAAIDAFFFGASGSTESGLNT